MAIIVNGVTYELPADDGVASKVPSYNAALIALAAMTESAWAAWTPTLTGIAIGTGGGAALTGKYAKIGKLVIARLYIKFGTSGATLPTGDFTVSPPVTMASYAGTATLQRLGGAVAFDVSAADAPQGTAVWATASTIKLRFSLASGTYVAQSGTSTPSGTVPFTWATGDEIYLDLVFEAA